MIGDNTRALLLENNLTQTELAKRSGCGTGDISRYVNNKAMPRVKTLQRLADALGVTVDELRNSDLRERMNVQCSTTENSA